MESLTRNTDTGGAGVWKAQKLYFNHFMYLAFFSPPPPLSFLSTSMTVW